jgi:hypothetical protein
MSDIFSGLQGGGIRFPDAQFNAGGPLPPSSSPAMHMPPVKINDTAALLSGIKPYDYGKGTNVSDDLAYQNIPVKIQKIIPLVKLPGAQNVPGNMITLTHPVDDGDLAFVLRFRNNIDEYRPNQKYFVRQGLARAVDTIVNLPTINYILRGLQTKFDTNLEWLNFLNAFDCGTELEAFQHDDLFVRQEACTRFIRDCVSPLGVVIGSEKQGGQTQGTNEANDWPVDFVATICVDGFNENMVNVWRRCKVDAGDQLLLHITHAKVADASDPVAPLVMAQPTNLNHYYKNQTSQLFDSGLAIKKDVLFELVPTTARACNKGKVFRCAEMTNKSVGTNFEQVHCIGMWHIATSQVMSHHTTGNITSGSKTGTGFRDDMQNIRAGGLLQSTVCPVWLPNINAYLFDNLHGEFIKGDPVDAAREVLIYKKKGDTTHKSMFGAAFPSQKFNVGVHNFKTVAAHMMRSDKKVDAAEAHMNAVHFMRHVINNPVYVSQVYDTATKQHVGEFTDAFKTLVAPTNNATKQTKTAPEPIVHAKRPQSVPLFQQIAASVVANDNANQTADDAAGSKPRRKQSSEPSKAAPVKRKVDETVRL